MHLLFVTKSLDVDQKLTVKLALKTYAKRHRLFRLLTESQQRQTCVKPLTPIIFPFS